MLPSSSLARLPEIWSQRIGDLVGARLELVVVDEVASPTAWAVGALRVGAGPSAAWWGMSQRHAIALSGQLLGMPTRAVDDLLRGRAANPLVEDAFGEIANLAFAGLGRSLRRELGEGVRAWKTSQSLNAAEPPAEVVLAARLELAGHPDGAVVLRVA